MKRNPLVPVLALCLLTVLAVSCGGPSGIQALVPESAAMYAQVGNLDTLLDNTEGFIKEIGSQALLDNKSLKEFLDGQLSSSLKGVSLSMFDLKKPVGAAVILPGVSGKDPTIIVYLPMKDAKKDFDTLKGAIGGEGTTTKIVQAGVYAIVYDSPDELKFPPEKSLDISGLKAYKPDSLAFVVNVKGLLAQYGAALDAGVSAAVNGLKSEGLANQEETAQMVEKTAKLFVDAVRQMDALNGALLLTKDGLETRSTMIFQKDSGLAKFAKALSASKGTAGWAKYLPKDHLISVVTNLSPEARNQTTDFFLDLLGSFPGIEQSDITTYRTVMKKIFDQSGNRSTMGFDLGIDGKKISQLEEAAGGDPSAIVAQAFGAFNFNVAAAFEAKNGPAYLNAMRAVYTDPAFAAIMDKSTLQTGLKVSFALEDKKEGDLSYTMLKMLWKVTSAQKLGLADSGLNERMMESVFQQLTDKLLAYMSPTKDKLFLTMGDGGLDALTSMVKTDAHPGDLSKDAAFQAFSKLAGDDGQMLMRLSTNKLMSLITTVLGASTGSTESFTMPEGANMGMWASMKAEGNSLKGVGFWSTKEIQVIVQQATTLYMNSLSRSMSDYEMTPDQLEGGWLDEESDYTEEEDWGGEFSGD
jgi:hypothetical protein